MLQKNKKLKKRKAKRSSTLSYIFLGILILFVIGFLVNTNLKISKKRSELSKEIEYLKEEVRALEQINLEMEETISRAGTQEYLETVALEQLGLKPPGAEVVVVTKEEKEEDKEEKEDKKNIWQRFLERIGF